MGVGISVCGCVDGGVGAGNGSADRITFGFDDGYDLGYSGVFFDSYSVDKYIVRYLYESLENNMELYLICLRLAKTLMMVVEEVLVSWLRHC